MTDRDGTMLRDSLVEQRKILVSGLLGHDAISGMAAQLMAFDGASSRHVEIAINSPGGPLSDIFPVLDVLNLMRANVNVTAIGSVSGTAVALVAACSGERRAATHATFSFQIDATQTIEGTAGDIVRHADELARLRHRYLDMLSAATGQDQQLLARQIDRGHPQSAAEAITFGIVDTIANTKEPK